MDLSGGPSGADTLRIRVDTVVRIDAVFIASSFGPADQRWLASAATTVVNQCWPGFLDALRVANPHAEFQMGFARSPSQVVDVVNRECRLLGTGYLLQFPTRAAMVGDAEGAERKFGVALVLYLSGATRAAILPLPETRIVPDAEA